MSWEEEEDPADAGVVYHHPRPRPLHPRHWSSDLSDRRTGSLLHLCLPRYTARHLLCSGFLCSFYWRAVKPTQCFFKFTGLCLMQAKLSETDVRSARWGSAVNLLSSGLLSASVYIFSFFSFFFFSQSCSGYFAWHSFLISWLHIQNLKRPSACEAVIELVGIFAHFLKLH